MQDKLYGVYRAVVVSTQDPSNKRRVRLKAPQVSGNAELQWAEPTNSDSPIPAVNSIVWVMFNGGYINKPLYIPNTNEDDLVWHTITPISGYAHNGNSEGTVMYTTYMFRGTRYVEWQGGLDVDGSGTEGSFTIPNGGTFFTMTDPDLIPSSRRTITCAKNAYQTANYFSNTAKIDFNTSGNCTIIAGTAFSTSWISLNGLRYVVN